MRRGIAILVCLGLMIAAIIWGCNNSSDNSLSGERCESEACNTACVTAGNPSGVCSNGECVCLEATYSG
jgi:hypothetical protein